MRRRDFITLAVGSTVGWPLIVHAQQSKRHVVGFLSGASPQGFAEQVAAFRKGLSQVLGKDEQNVSLEYRWGHGHYDRMSALAAELVTPPVDVIFASGGDASAKAAKTATSAIPVVFLLGGDPVASGMVATLGRPGGNLTGITLAFALLEQKRLEILHQVVPSAQTVAVLINPLNPRAQEDETSIRSAAAILGLTIVAVYAKNSGEFAAALGAARQQGASALDVASDPLFLDQSQELVAEVAKLGIPAIYHLKEQVTAGGLISYGAPIRDMYRQAGIYVGEILRGAKPADLPVLQPTKYELHLNLKSAEAVGLKVPTSLLLQADEVIE